MAHDAFISYSAVDKVTADAACARLEARGIRCWIAPRDVVGGLDWSAEIVDAIAASGVLVLVFSKRSNESPQVKREVERAVSRGLPVIPFRIEDVPLSKHMEFFISTPHWLDALTPPLEAHLDRLVETVAFVLDRTASLPRLPTGASTATDVPRPRPIVASLANWPAPPQLQMWEERFIDALRPVLRPRASVNAVLPVGGVIVALLVGAIGLWSGLAGLFKVVVPGQTEAILFQGFPWLRIANLFGTAAGATGSLALLVGADWMLRERTGGREVALAACRLLAISTFVWFVLAILSYSSNWPMASVTGMVPATFSLAATAWILQAVTHYMVRGRRATPEVTAVRGESRP